MVEPPTLDAFKGLDMGIWSKAELSRVRILVGFGEVFSNCNVSVIRERAQDLETLN